MTAVVNRKSRFFIVLLARLTNFPPWYAVTLTVGNRAVRSGRRAADPAGRGTGHYCLRAAGARCPAGECSRRNRRAVEPDQCTIGCQKPPGTADLENRSWGADRRRGGPAPADSVQHDSVPQLSNRGGGHSRSPRAPTWGRRVPVPIAAEWREADCLPPLSV